MCICTPSPSQPPLCMSKLWNSGWSKQNAFDPMHLSPPKPTCIGYLEYIISLHWGKSWNPEGKEPWSKNFPRYLLGLSRALFFPTTFMETAVYVFTKYGFTVETVAYWFYFLGCYGFSPIHQFFLFICLETFWICYLLTYMLHGKNILINTIFYAFYSPGHRQFCLYYGLMKHTVTVQVLKT